MENARDAYVASAAIWTESSWTPDSDTTCNVGDKDVPFAFAAPVQEYAALRGDAGHYDLSIFGRVSVRGSGALPFVQRVLTRDVQYLLPEMCTMGLVVDAAGAVDDIVTVFTGDDGSFELQTSIGAGTSTAEVLNARRNADDGVELLLSPQAGVAIEGPSTWTVLEGLGLEHMIDLPFQGVRATSFEGERVRVARTGMTGEFGVELLTSRDLAAKLLAELPSVCPRVGLAALEAAMLDVRHPNLWRECFGVEVARAGLQWLVDFQKEDYIGRNAILRQTESPSVSRVGFTALSQGVIAPGANVRLIDEIVGRVIWSTYSPGRGGLLGVVELDDEIAVPGLRMLAGDDEFAVVIESLSSPLVIPGSWAVVAAERAAQLAGANTEPA